MSDEGESAAKDPNLDPVLFGTQKQVAWAAWQAAFDAGRYLPDLEKFQTWWREFGLTVRWGHIREMMQAAWGKGVQDRNEQCTAGFNSWWQALVDAGRAVDGDGRIIETESDV